MKQDSIRPLQIEESLANVIPCNLKTSLSQPK